MSNQHINSDMCTGCGACEFVCNMKAISLIKNRKGFIISLVDESKCTNCGACVTVCHKEQSISNDFGREYEQYAVKLKNTESRKRSRSGGAFVAISDEILKQGGAVFGAVLNEYFCITHICACVFQQNSVCVPIGLHAIPL